MISTVIEIFQHVAVDVDGKAGMSHDCLCEGIGSAVAIDQSYKYCLIAIGGVLQGEPFDESGRCVALCKRQNSGLCWPRHAGHIGHPRPRLAISNTVAEELLAFDHDWGPG